jgi:DNA replication ATP-dependent helicase Dna2
MELLNNLVQAIDIQQKCQNDDFHAMMSKPVSERISKGHTLSNLSISKIDFYDEAPNNFCPRLDAGNKFVDKIYIHCPNNCSRFREGASVMLTNGVRKLVMDIVSDGIDDFVLHSNDFEVKNNVLNASSFPKNNWELNAVNTDITHRLLMASWQKLNDNADLLHRMENILSGNQKNTYSENHVSLTDNESQNKAIQRALGCSDFCIIQGPPGTGKTFTIAKLTAALVAEGKKVFITSPTHTAINNCLKDISNELQDKSKVVKLGDAYQATEIAGNQYISRKSKLPFYSYSSDRNFSHNGFVVGATPYALCYPASKKLQGWNFDYVIIDEAAQMSIPLALAAMVYGDKIVFVGDHKQLDPIVPQQSGNVLFDSSIFKKVVDLYPGQISLLNQSYRLNENLIRVPNNLFYNGSLKSHCSVNTEYMKFHCANYPDIINNPSSEILYVHHEFDSLGRSPFEAKVAAGIVSDLLSNGVELKQIGLMSPYRAQIREIKRAIVEGGVLKEENMNSLFIDTVDRMQGQEKDYIIFSLSNSNPAEVEDRLEFFYSPNRLNVAITRARIKCVVITNEKIFKTSSAMADNPENSKELNEGMRTFNEYYKLSTKIENKNTGEEDW